MTIDEGMPTIKLGENWKQNAYVAAVKSLEGQLALKDPASIERAYAVVTDMEERLWHLSDARRRDAEIAAIGAKR